MSPLPDEIQDTGEARELSVFELYDQRRHAEHASLEVVQLLGHILDSTNQLELLIEGEIESPFHQNRAINIIRANEDDAVQIAEFLHELVAQHTALIAMLRRAIEQRDEAMRGKLAWMDNLADTIAENQGCSRAQAWKLITVLINPDETLMADDVVIGLDRLIEFRDELQPLIDNLDEDVYLPEDE
jgi:hypothetical protein